VSVQVPAKQPKLFQVLLSFSSSIASRLFSVTIAFAKKFCVPHATTQVSSLGKSMRREGDREKFISKIFDSPRFLRL